MSDPQPDSVTESGSVPAVVSDDAEVRAIMESEGIAEAQATEVMDVGRDVVLADDVEGTRDKQVILSQIGNTEYYLQEVVEPSVREEDHSVIVSSEGLEAVEQTEEQIVILTQIVEENSAILDTSKSSEPVVKETSDAPGQQDLHEPSKEIASTSQVESEEKQQDDKEKAAKSMDKADSEGTAHEAEDTTRESKDKVEVQETEATKPEDNSKAVIAKKSKPEEESTEKVTRKSRRSIKTISYAEEMFTLPAVVKKELDVDDDDDTVDGNMANGLETITSLPIEVEDVDSRHSRYVLRSACQLLNDGQLLDVTLCCEGTTISAHRLVLAAYSTHLHNMLLQDQTNQMCSFISLDHLNISAASAKALVEYMYSGKIVKSVPKEELLEAAKVLGMTKAISDMERRRGRPPLRQSIGAEETKKDSPQVKQVETPVKRGRGRPRKYPRPDEEESKEKQPAAKVKGKKEGPEENVLRELQENDSMMSLAAVKEDDVSDNAESAQDFGDDDDDDDEDGEYHPNRPSLKRKAELKLGILPPKKRRHQSSISARAKEAREKGEGKPKRKVIRAIKREDGQYQCVECDFVSPSDRTMYRHRLTKHSTERPHVCHHCSKSFKLRKYLVQHLAVHSDERPYSCEVCNAKFRAAKHRNRHRKTHNTHKDYLCEECGKGFNSATMCRNHFLAVHKGEKPYKCVHEGCEYTAIDPYSLKKHVLKHSKERESILCEVCGKAFSCPMSLKHHVKSVHGEASFQCKQCQYKANTKYGLISHMARIHNTTMDGRPASRTFQCEVCDFSCFTKQEFNLHQLKHKGEKPHKCPVCSFATAEKGSLTKHLRLHTGEKPYQCDLCPMKFSHPAGISRHRITHTGIKPHQCHLCGKAYVKKSSLDAHMSTHTNIKPFKCHLCSYACIKKDILNNHLAKEHGIHRPKSAGPVARYKRRIMSDPNAPPTCQLVPIVQTEADDDQDEQADDIPSQEEEVYASMEAAAIVQHTPQASSITLTADQYENMSHIAQGQDGTIYAIQHPAGSSFRAGTQQQQRQPQRSHVSASELAHNPHMTVVYEMDKQPVEFHPTTGLQQVREKSGKMIFFQD